jgi:outer membrane lipoprotein SlyB
MSKFNITILALLPLMIASGCSKNTEARSDDTFKATPAQKAASIEMHKTVKEKRSNYHQ